MQMSTGEEFSGNRSFVFPLLIRPHHQELDAVLQVFYLIKSKFIQIDVLLFRCRYLVIINKSCVLPTNFYFI